jgi:cyclase
MKRVRVIPTLLLNTSGGLVKTIGFGNRTYLGDPINAVKIFNEKEVDELLLLDIDASKSGRPPAYATIEDIASEAFMPVGYGGGIRSLEDMDRLFYSGIEKIILSTAALKDLGLVKQAVDRFGAQSVVGCLDVRPSWLGYRVTICSGAITIKGNPEVWAKKLAEAGVGELIVNNISRDGTYRGYDLALLKTISDSVTIPVVACGGAANVNDFHLAIAAGCSAVAAGSLFVYQGRQKGVLISYPGPIFRQ